MWETLHNYLDKQCDTIAGLLPEISKKAGKKEVHKLRVSVKRARACLALAKYIYGDSFKGKQSLRTLKVLHLSVGTLRDITLQQEHLRRYTKQNPQPYRVLQLLLKNHSRLSARQAQTIAAAFPLRSIKTLPKQLGKKQPPDKAVSPKAISQYLQEQYDAIAAPTVRVAAEKWHDLRKDVKRLHYQLEILQPGFDKQPLQQMLDFTGKVGSQLGAWHDLVAFRQFIKESMQLMQGEQVTIPKGATPLLRQLTKDISTQLQQCRMLLQQKPAIMLA